MVILRLAGLCFLLVLGYAVFAHQLFAQDGPHLLPAPKLSLPDAPKVNLPDAPKPTAKFPGNDLTGIGPVDLRTTVDQNVMPWRAVGRLVISGASCTGALVAPALLLTAAHCVFSPQTRQLVPPSSLHFMLAYSEGRYQAEAFGTHITVPDDYDPVLGIGTMGNDWALVRLDHAIGQSDGFIPLSAHAPTAGVEVALGGYAKDHIEFLTVDLHCHVLGLILDQKGMPLIHHDCMATHGVSGAPLLMHGEAGWTIGGIEVVGTSNAGGGASALYDVITAMAKIAK
ncbi:MAG: trypsin-like serine protease [Rhodospirillaceae bacterium]|nr:MAG: trypsin-like serine protease [Rhodospirillaceae bacterium]